MVLVGLVAGSFVATLAMNSTAGRRMQPTDGKPGSPGHSAALPNFENTIINGVEYKGSVEGQRWEMYPYIDSGGSKAAIMRLRGNRAGGGVVCRGLAHDSSGNITTTGVGVSDSTGCVATGQTVVLPAVTVPTSPALGSYTISCQMPAFTTSSSCKSQIRHAEL
jgi:hypothetical protein